MNIRRRQALWGLGLACGVMGLTGCFGGGKEASGQEPGVADGVLNVGIIDGQDIYGAGTEAGFTGIEPELMERFARELGAGIEYTEAADLDELLGMTETGQVDVAVGRIALRDEYSQTCVASASYGKGGLYLVTRENDFTDTLAGFPEEQVGISEGISSAVKSDIPYLEQVVQTEYSDLTAAVRDMEEGLIQAVLCTEREAISLLGEGVQAQELRKGPGEAYAALLPAGQEANGALLNAVISQYLDEKAQGLEGAGAETEQVLLEEE